MQIIKIFGIVLLGLIGLSSIVRGIFAIIAVVMIITIGEHSNISYVLGQFAGSALLLAISVVGIKALLKSMKAKSISPPPLVP